MKLSTQIAWGSVWTAATYGASQLVRFAANVALARLLAPELFGIMVIVNSVRLGVQLTTDVGITQNIIVSPNGEKPEFYNTAWTINLLRSVGLFLLCVLIASPLAHFYRIAALSIVFPVAGFLFVFEGLSSTARPLVQRRLRFARFSIYEFLFDSFGFASLVVWASISPTIWALVLGGFLASAARMVGSYVLLPGIRHRFYISREYAWQIIGFSKWIFVSSIAMFFSINFDRLYLGKVIPVEFLGVYGIARTLAEILSLVVGRLSSFIVFPMIASKSEVPRLQLRRQLFSIRIMFLLAVGVGLSMFVATADFLIAFLYDQRYQAAGWITPILALGTWFTLICNLNESTLLGFGKPSYGAFANGAKLAWLLIGLPIAFSAYGVMGAVAVIATSDLLRYPPILIGQIRSRFSFALQDFVSTIVFFGLIVLWGWVRWTLGGGAISFWAPAAS